MDAAIALSNVGTGYEDIIQGILNSAESAKKILLQATKLHAHQIVLNTSIVAALSGSILLNAFLLTNNTWLFLSEFVILLLLT